MTTTGVLDTTYLPVAFGSFVAFMIIYKYASPKLSSLICPKYQHLTEQQQINWNTRTMSSIHSVIMGYVCIYTMLYDPDVRKDPIWRHTVQVRIAGAILIGYSVADTIVMAIHYKQIGEPFYFLHHASAAYAFFYVSMFGVLPYFSNYRLLSEISTPLVNQRWFFSTLGYKKDNKYFIINGVVMTLVFFLTRLACMPYYWFMVYTVYNTEPFTRLGHMQYVLLGTCSVLDIINFFWFYRMMHGVYKVVSYLINKENDIPLKEDWISKQKRKEPHNSYIPVFLSFFFSLLLSISPSFLFLVFFSPFYCVLSLSFFSVPFDFSRFLSVSFILFISHLFLYHSFFLFLFIFLLSFSPFLSSSIYLFSLFLFYILSQFLFISLPFLLYLFLFIISLSLSLSLAHFLFFLFSSFFHSVFDDHSFFSFTHYFSLRFSLF